MTSNSHGRHRAPAQLHAVWNQAGGRLRGAAVIAAAGLLTSGTLAASTANTRHQVEAAPAHTLTATPAAAWAAPDTLPAAREASVWRPSSEVRAPREAQAASRGDAAGRAEATSSEPPVDEPVTPQAAPADPDHPYAAALGFVGITPEPVPAAAPAAQDQPVAAAPARESTTAASRTQAREAAPAQSQPATAPVQPAPAPASEPAPVASSGGGESAIGWAQNHLGLPYRVGSTGPGGYDCSGFTKMAYASAGVTLPHGSGAQYHATGRVSLSSIQRGDLLFYSSNGSSSGIYNVAIYLGGGQVIHSLRDWSGAFSGSKITGINYSPGLMGAARP